MAQKIGLMLFIRTHEQYIIIKGIYISIVMIIYLVIVIKKKPYFNQ
jgi:hypothetical protein